MLQFCPSRVTNLEQRLSVKFTVPSPQEVGLPEQFHTWRPNQSEAIAALLDTSKRGQVVEAPTGFGKQNVAVATGLLSEESTCIVVPTLGLQDQYAKTYADCGLTDIRGRGQYDCAMRDDYTCEDGYLSRCPYKGSVACPSSKAEIVCSTSRLVCTNYDKWTSSKKFGAGMSHFTRVIFDEGDCAPDALARAMQVTLHHREINKDLEMDFPQNPEALWMSTWKMWSGEAKLRAQEEMEIAYDKIKGVSDPKPSWVKHYNHMKNLHRRLSTIFYARSADWIVDEVEGGYQFDPIRPAQYAESALLFKIPHLGFLSATIIPKTLYLAGLAKTDYNYHSFPSDFDPKDCPIYYVPTMRVNYKATDLSRIWLLLDQVAIPRSHQKGIVHTISYARRETIMRECSFGDRVIYNERGEAPSDKIQEYKDAPGGAVMVSPSIGRGYDFPGRECEWQFVVKVPYPPPSKIILAREEQDKEYRPYLAMQKLVQMFGRGARFRGDQCQNFIGDTFMGYFKDRYSHLAPKWFHGFYKQVDILPKPLRSR